MALINCVDVSLSYENRIVLSDLTFSVNKGDYLCIVGENGSGKSTLIKALISLKSISSGSIKFGDGLKKNEIGYLPQQTGIQRDFPATVWEIVLSGCLNGSGFSPFFSKKDKIKAEENLEKMRISGLKNRPYRDLSGGQQQRVLLARALCATSKLLLLDEPATGLDPLVTNELYGIIKDINKSGITVIMVSHDLKNTVEYASHILHLHNKPLFFGTVAEYKKSHIGKHFLGAVEHQYGE